MFVLEDKSGQRIFRTADRSAALRALRTLPATRLMLSTGGALWTHEAYSLEERTADIDPFRYDLDWTAEERPVSKGETGVRWQAVFPDRPEFSLRGYSLFWEGWLGEIVYLIEGCIARESTGGEICDSAGSLFRVRAVLLKDPPQVLFAGRGGLASLPRLVCAAGDALWKTAGPLIQGYIPERTFWWNGRVYFLPNGEMAAVVQVEQIDRGGDNERPSVEKTHRD